MERIEMAGDDWRIVGGPKAIEGPIDGLDMSHGWAWDIARVGVWRTVRICVAGSTTPDWPDQCAEAIETRGRSIVERLLHQETPSLTVRITTSGIIEK